MLTQENHPRDYKRGNYGLINSALTKVDWDALMEGNSEECWTCFKNLLLEMEDALYTTTYIHNQTSNQRANLDDS